MWNAFVNGGAGGGGGYVPSQGWEFVPCARADRGRAKNRNPLRRISSPPSIFSQISEPLFGPAAAGGGGEGLGGTPVEVFRAQMWPGSDLQQQQQQQQPQQQTQLTRLKKKLEDLKKRHVQDKEEWMREKGLLLREMADIQGGENRRILLDLKLVLEEVQAEVKREEEKRSELQLQYTRDRCAWEVERAQLTCRIAQLETRESAPGPVSSEAQTAAGPSSGGRPGETATFRREREEQRRLLADTHSAAMDLRWRLEHSERDWSREKAELLERFDTERKEWENQLKDMQRKIEELYCEVRAKRGAATPPGSGRHDDYDDVLRLSTNSTSAGSSPLSSSTPSDPSRPRRAEDWRAEACPQMERLGQPGLGGHFPQEELADDLRSAVPWPGDSVGTNERAEDTAGPLGVPGRGGSQNSDYTEQNVSAGPRGGSVWMDQNYCSEKKKNNTALNAALKEIARVSEELCSYQDEIRKKAGDGRTPESLCIAEEEHHRDLNELYDDLRALGRETWITSSPENTWHPNDSFLAPDSHRDKATNCGSHPETEAEAPAVPPRSSSWNLSTPTKLDTELHIPDSPLISARKCHSPCVLVDRKCSSPSVVRKFEAMLQENEGKVLIDGSVAPCSVPANSNCNAGCCHSRWSCDVSKLANAKPSHGTVHKSFSEVNIVSAAKDRCSEYHTQSTEERRAPSTVQDPAPAVRRPSLEIPSPNLQGSRRNILLELKTAEFNRTLFQAEMGRGVDEPERFVVADVSSVDFRPCSSIDEFLPKEAKEFHCSEVHTRPHAASKQPEVTLFHFIPDSSNQQSGRAWSVDEGQEASAAQEVLSDISTDDSPVRHSARRGSSPANIQQHRAATDDPHLESAPHVSNACQARDTECSTYKSETPRGGSPHPGPAAGSPQPNAGENKSRKTTKQPRPAAHADPSRPGPRMMNDHPWKPLTLAAYPRPEGSRSNYGAVERILKNYETAARAQQSQSEQDRLDPSPDFPPSLSDDITEQRAPCTDPLLLPTAPRHNPPTLISQTHTPHGAKGVKEPQLAAQERKQCPASTSQKSFSRRARPANRRLPSRWASRSPPSSSSSASPSSSATPLVSLSCPFQKHASSFTYSHTFHMETVII